MKFKSVFMALIAALAACLFAFSGCAAVSVFEKNVTVVLSANGDYYDTYTVNIFNNAVVSELPESDDPDEIFLGWTAKEDYIAYVDSEELILSNKSLIRYADIKDYIQGENLQVTLYAVFGEKPSYDLVVGWYAKSGTTGLTQDMMTAYTEALNAYLYQNGYTELNIDIREYSATYDVATVGATVNADGDVDILIGMGKNIESTGGIKSEELQNYTIGGKSRNIARLTNGELVEAVFAWMQTDEARALFA